MDNLDLVERRITHQLQIHWNWMKNIKNPEEIAKLIITWKRQVENDIRRD